MAVIPLTTARPQLAEMGAVQYPQGGGPIGAALQEAGHSLQRTAEHWQQQQDQLDAFKLRIALNETPGILDGALQTSAQGIQPDGSGFAKGFAGEIDPHTGAPLKPGAFDPIWQQQMAKVPESVRGKFAAMEPYYRQAYANKAAGIEQGQRTDWARVEGTKAEIELSNLIAQSDPNDPKAFERFKKEGEEFWANAPGLDPAEKEKRSILWNDTAADAYWKAKKINDPIAAKAALGIHDEETFTNIGNVSGFHDAIARAEGTSGKGDYNAVLGLGKYGLPSRPITEMTLAQAYEFGRTVRARHGESSALGRYQIVGQTMRLYADKLGLDWNTTKFDAKTQDALAVAIFQGQGLSAWEGFKSHPGELATAKAAVASGDMNAGQGPTVAAAGGGAGTRTVPGYIGPPDPEFAGLTLEHRLQLGREADAEINRRQVDARVNLEQVFQDAPAAVEATGSYTGTIPDSAAFVAAYGPQEGTQKAAQFGAAMDVAHNVFDMQTMPNDAINGLVAGAKAAIPSGPGAALQTAEYTSLARAAEQTQKARAADPAAYVQQAFPAVRQAWQNPGAPGTPAFEAALRASAEAQKSLGILPENMALLPKSVVEQATDRFKSPDVPEEQQIAAVEGLVFSTNDRDQQQAIFRQLVKNGLPDFTEGAFEAAARGDRGAFKNLMLAALTDPEKLGGTLAQTENKPAKIRQVIQESIFAPEQIGDVALGISNGDASNFERLKRDTELLTRSVQLRMVGGSSLQDAVEGAKKDLYGDREPVAYDSSPQGPGASILFPVGTDTTPVPSGLTAEFLKFNDVANAHTTTQQPVARPGTSDQKIISTVGANRVNDIMHNGVYRNVNGGIGLFDPYTGLFLESVSDPGKPFTVPLEEVLQLGKMPGAATNTERSAVQRQLDTMTGGEALSPVEAPAGTVGY